MNKKENLFTTTLRLNLNNAQDMEAWNNLMSTDRNQPEYSSYSRTIVTAINDHFARQDRMEEQQEWETALLKKIEATILETPPTVFKGSRSPLRNRLQRNLSRQHRLIRMMKQKRTSKPSWTASEGCTTSGITTDRKMIPLVIPDQVEERKT